MNIINIAEVRKARENQRQKFIEDLANAFVDLDKVNVGKAMVYLSLQISPLRDKIKKYKTLFGADTWKTSKGEKILALLAQQVLKCGVKEFEPYHPELLDWLFAHGYETEGESTKELSHINIDTKDIPEKDECTDEESL